MRSKLDDLYFLNRPWLGDASKKNDEVTHALSEECPYNHVEKELPVPGDFYFRVETCLCFL